MTQWIACMFHIHQDEFDYIESTLLDYDIQGYIIGHEMEPFSHYHLLFQGTNQIYNAFSKRLIEKYNLRGKAGKDQARQYGRISKIKDLEHLKSYTVKDGNYRTNLNEQEITKIIENSFKKANTLSLIDEIGMKLSDLHNETHILTNTMTEHFKEPSFRWIIKQLIQKKHYKISKAILRNILLKAIIFNDNIPENLKTKKILDII